MSIVVRDILERFSQLLKLESGDGSTPCIGLSAPSIAAPKQMIFIADAKHLDEAQNTKSKIWVVHKNLLSRLTDRPSDLLLISSGQVQLAMALIGKTFFAQKLNKVPFGEMLIHPSSVVDASAQLGEGVIVGPNATIGAGAKIGAHTIIGANTTIEAQVEIGRGTHIHPQVYIAYLCRIGDECEIHPQTSIGTEGFGYVHDQQGHHHRLTHYGRVVIGDRVHIGAGVQIDRGTFLDSVIGSDTIIDNHCHFGHNIRIGSGNIITGGMITAGSVTIGDRCVFGGRTTIAGHLTIASGCQFAGLSGINSSIEKPGQYGGYPPQPLKDSLKAIASLPHLPKIRRNLNRVLKHLGLETEET